MANLTLPDNMPASGKIAICIKGRKYTEYRYGTKYSKNNLSNPRKIVQAWNALFLDSPELSIRITQ